jgi:hypothetical protein
MSKTDLIWFLIAGLVGAVGSYERPGGAWVYGRSLAWAIVALWAFLGLVGVIAY